MSPKTDFLKSPYREPLEKWVTTKDAEAARDAALLEFVNQQPTKSGAPEAWDEHSKLVGARRILEILFTLPFKEMEPPRQPMRNIPPPK